MGFNPPKRFAGGVGSGVQGTTANENPPTALSTIEGCSLLKIERCPSLPFTANGARRPVTPTVYRAVSPLPKSHATTRKSKGTDSTTKSRPPEANHNRAGSFTGPARISAATSAGISTPEARHASSSSRATLPKRMSGDALTTQTLIAATHRPVRPDAIERGKRQKRAKPQ